MKRNCSVELYRICLMLGIVWLHVVNQGPYRHVFPSNVLLACVPGFVLITGYFGAHYRLSKIVRLYALAFWCLLLTAFLGMSGEYVREVIRLWRPQYGWWFLHAYVVMLVISPAIDGFLGKTWENDRSQIFLWTIPFLFVVFVWGWLTTFNSLKCVVPSPKGLHAFSFLTLMGVYVVGRIVRLYRLDEKCSQCGAIVGLIICVALVSMSGYNLASYNSPIQVLLAFFCFVVISKIRMKRNLQRSVELVAPSMFSVFLLHVIIYFPGMSRCDYAFINFLMEFLIRRGINWYLSSVIVAIACFSACLLLDLPRRVIVAMMQKSIHGTCQRIDEYAHRFCSWVESKM